MEAIYFIEENKGALKRRIDSGLIETLHSSGFTIIKMWLDGKFTEERLEPAEKIPDGFIQESRYGLVVFNVDQVEEGE